MLRRLRVAALALVAAPLLLPPAAQAADRTVPKGFLGVVADRSAVDGTVPLGAQMRRMASSGAETVGLAFNWLDAQPDANRPPDFASIDRRVRAAAAAGLAVHPVLIAAPAWARKNPGEEFSPPADPAAYAAFAAELVRRYGPRGSFWDENPKLRRLPIADWQIWNEPVGGDGDATPSVFWVDDEPFEQGFIALMRAARDAIKAVDPSATVVMGALVGRSWQTLQRIYDAGGRGAFDAVALHPYTSDAKDVVRIVRYVRATMARNGDGALPIQITELGWPAFDAASVRKLGRKRSFAVQAGWLRATFRRLISQRERLGIDLLLWYTWIGTDRSDRDAFDHSGLLTRRADGRLRAKPSLGAFSAVARRAQGRSTG